jgi:hypothetical protein
VSRGPSDEFPLLDVAAAEERYGYVRQRGALAPSRRFDELIRQFQPVDVQVLLHRDDVGATAVGRNLWLLDREVRRAAAIVRQRPFRSFPRPLPPSRSGLRVADTRPGSLDLLLEPFGLVRDLLLSDPVQMTLTFFTLMGGVRWLRARRRPPDQAKREEGEAVSIHMPRKLRVTAPANARVRVRLADGSEVDIGPDSDAN